MEIKSENQMGNNNTENLSHCHNNAHVNNILNFGSEDGYIPEWKIKCQKRGKPGTGTETSRYFTNCNIQPCSYLHLTRHLYFKCSIISSLVELCFEGPKGCQQAVSISLSLSIVVSLSFNPVLILNSITYNKVNIPFLYLKLSCASFSTKLIVIYLGLAPLGKAAPYRANATPF